MYRNTTVGSLPLGLNRLLAVCSSTRYACAIALGVLTLLAGAPLRAQSSSGGITGTVTDKSGAVIPKAEVTATNTETGVQQNTQTNGTGNYSISPLQPGNYNLEVVAKGFQRLLQENVDVTATAVQRVDPKLTIGGENTTVTITDAPPFLDTTDATLGGTIENELYSQLPLSMNGGPRDPTAFQYLMPGVQENPANNTGTGANNGNSGIYGGTGQTNLNANYIDGVPVPNIAQQGSSNPISSAVSVDAVDQFSVQTNNASAAFGGAGSTNYTIKSGGNQFHGTVFDYTRNTMFDTWGYFAKVPAASGFAVKPGEHQNSYGGSLGGPILKDKLFFFASYEGYHYTKISNTPQYITVPTLAERTGNFTDVLGTLSPAIVDSSVGTTRLPFQGLVNGVPTYNVIPTSEISDISWYLENGCHPVGCAAVKGSLPPPTSLSTFNNFLAGLPLANSDYSVDTRLDFTLNARNKLSLDGIGGNVGYGGEPFYTSQNQLPVPYSSGQFTNQKTASGIFTYTYIISQSMINTLKYGYTRTWGQGYSLTQGKNWDGTKTTAACTGTNSCAAGITNIPVGNASASMPAVSFSASAGPTAPQNWPSNSNTGPTATNSYTVIEQLQWLRGRHNITYGLQAEWLETNGGSYGGYSKTLALTYSSLSTAGTGDAYASFLLGAVNSGSISAQTIQDVGARYRPLAGYVIDTWRTTPKLTLTMQLRYDYLQPYHEVQDRLSFLNVNVKNPIVGVPGVLEYAGFPGQGYYKNLSLPAIYNSYICHCTTPVKPYNKNLQPRVALAYAANASTVISAGFSIQLTNAGGAGGGAGATQGTGNSGLFSTSTGFQQAGGSTSPPGFFLNPSIQGAPINATFDPPIQGTQTPGGSAVTCSSSSETGNCNFSAIPPWLPPGTSVNPLQSTGNYNFGAVNQYNCGTSDNANCNGQGVNFADPYYGGRGPQFINYNFGIQRQINKKAVLTLSYAGSQTHFLPGGSGRGYATNKYSPDYDLELRELLPTPAQTATNAVQSILPNYKLPYLGFTGPGATVSASLTAYPQFAGSNAGGLTDLWGDTGNASFNSFQMLLIQRPWHNLSGFLDYTRAKEIDDTGNHRTQYPVGPQDGNFYRYYTANQIDRALGTSSQTNAFNLTWVYAFPIGRGQAFFASNRIAGLIGGGWTLKGIYKYRDGYPLQITGPGCSPHDYGGQGTCMPDYVPGFNKSQARINGRWGRGPGSNAANASQIPYLSPGAFECPDSSPANTTYTCGSASNTGPQISWKLGNAARTAPYDLHGPGWWDLDMGLSRTFVVRETATLHLTFLVEADVDNATNSTFFNSGGTQWDSSGYGTVSGQNQSVPPRDWQFQGRFRF
jgi:Carboxypeptidase regulatory-like domain